MAPIPPKHIVINIPLTDSLKAAFLSPNDRPAQAYEDREAGKQGW
jgi:glutamate/aspartate transport system substrate-binding protein